MKQEPTSKFLKLRCPKCKNEQVTFGKTATKINCHVCQESLATPTGGKTNVLTRVFEVLN